MSDQSKTMAAAVEKLTEDEIRAAKAAIDEEGVAKFAERIGIHEQTVYRMVGGFPVQRMTARFVRQHLEPKVDVSA
ncbi:MAG: hypothetical protein RIF41_38780 [Polyangiaceae bacterium]